MLINLGSKFQKYTITIIYHRPIIYKTKTLHDFWKITKSFSIFGLETPNLARLWQKMVKKEHWKRTLFLLFFSFKVLCSLIKWSGGVTQDKQMSDVAASSSVPAVNVNHLNHDLRRNAKRSFQFERMMNLSGRMMGQ